jgi:hypothetical protein
MSWTITVVKEQQNENKLPSFTANFVSLCLGCASSATNKEAQATTFT